MHHVGQKLRTDVVRSILTQPHCFYSYTFVSLPHFHSCVRCFLTVLSRSCCHFLSHAFSLTFCLAFLLMFSLVRGVLSRVLLSPIFLCFVFRGFIHSILHSLVLVDFVRVNFRSLVLLSLSTRGMFSYLFWNVFWMFVSQIQGFKKFWTKKLQMTITFDRELGLRRSKNENCSKWGNEAPDQPQKEVGLPKFQNSIIKGFFFSFLLFFIHFCRLQSLISHIYTC